MKKIQNIKALTDVRKNLIEDLMDNLEVELLKEFVKLSKSGSKPRIERENYYKIVVQTNFNSDWSRFTFALRGLENGSIKPQLYEDRLGYGIKLKKFTILLMDYIQENIVNKFEE